MSYPKPIKLTPEERLTEKIRKLRESQAKKIQDLKDRKKIQVERVRTVAKKRVIKAKEESIADLKKKAQKLRNKYAILRDKDLPCISCSIQEAQWNGGHFIAQGSSGALRFDILNINKQCVGCNLFKHGNLIEYRIGLCKKYGDGVVKDLEARRHDVKKWTREELHAIIDTTTLWLQEL